MLTITVDLDASAPVYRQIADELRALIARGELADGAVLPSVRRLGSHLGVNQNTVAKAYRILSDEGIVELRHGAAAKVCRQGHPYRQAPPDDAERKLQDLISRWVLAGATRPSIEQAFKRALDGYFGARGNKGRGK